MDLSSTVDLSYLAKASPAFRFLLLDERVLIQHSNLELITAGFYQPGVTHRGRMRSTLECSQLLEEAIQGQGQNRSVSTEKFREIPDLTDCLYYIRRQQFRESSIPLKHSFQHSCSIRKFHDVLWSRRKKCDRGKKLD